MKKPNRSGKSRVIILLVLCALVFGLFLARLIWMQFVQADYYAQKVAQASTTRYSYTVPAARGDIVDRNGEVLAQDTPVWDVSVKYPAPPGTTVQEVANRTLQLLQMTGGEDVETQLAAFCSAVSAGEFPLVSGLTAAQTAVLYDAGLVQSGAVRLTPSGVRSWPDGTLLPHALGTVGPITAEQWEELAGSGIAMNAQIGQSGLEAACEQLLHGTDGRVLVTAGSEGVLQEQLTKAPEPGAILQLTLDANLQRAVQQALADHLETLRTTKSAGSGREVSAGAVVVVDTETGGILAAANQPSFDLSDYRSNYAALAADPAAPLFDRTVQGLYAPGSAFKPAVAASALAAGLITPEDTVNCTGRYLYYSDYQPRCLQISHSGRVNLFTALKYSCNIFFYDVGRRLGVDRFSTTAQTLGLAADTGVEVASASGQLTWSTDENYTAGLALQAAIGQANTAVKRRPPPRVALCGPGAGQPDRTDAVAVPDEGVVNPTGRRGGLCPHPGRHDRHGPDTVRPARTGNDGGLQDRQPPAGGNPARRQPLYQLGADRLCPRRAAPGGGGNCAGIRRRRCQRGAAAAGSAGSLVRRIGKLDS